MSTQRYYERLRQQHEQSYYRDPDLTDPLYQRELACIRIARNATTAAGGKLCPTFAPESSFLAILFFGAKDHYDVYRVPVSKTVYWLWQKYRPTPWTAAGNQRVLESWLVILYGQDVAKAIGLTYLLGGTKFNDKETDRAAEQAGIYVSIKEQWEQVVEQVSDELPSYG